MSEPIKLDTGYLDVAFALPSGVRVTVPSVHAILSFGPQATYFPSRIQTSVIPHGHVIVKPETLNGLTSYEIHLYPSGHRLAVGALLKRCPVCSRDMESVEPGVYYCEPCDREVTE